LGESITRDDALVTVIKLVCTTSLDHTDGSPRGC
jgi:hypothetical protein